ESGDRHLVAAQEPDEIVAVERTAARVVDGVRVAGLELAPQRRVFGEGVGGDGDGHRADYGVGHSVRACAGSSPGSVPGSVSDTVSDVRCVLNTTRWRPHSRVKMLAPAKCLTRRNICCWSKTRRRYGRPSPNSSATAAITWNRPNPAKRLSHGW